MGSNMLYTIHNKQLANSIPHCDLIMKPHLWPVLPDGALLFFRTGHHQCAQICNMLQSVSSIYLEKQLFICCMSVGLCQSAAKGKGKGERNTKKKQTHESNTDWVPWG